MPGRYLHQKVLRAAALVGLLAALVLVPGTASSAASPQYGSGQGVTVVSATQVDARVTKVIVTTDELAKPVRVNVLLPAGYTTSTRRYPVLYLLHGTSGGADDWLTFGNVEAATSGLPLIVVMPDGGFNSNGGGWWTDWVDQSTALGRANWESFHIKQVIPWVDAHLRTVASRRGRAIAGLSQGGFGAFSYAARNPDLFVAAASFSGAPDIAEDPLARLGGGLIVGAIMAQDGVEPFAAFGNPLTQSVIWQGHNPASLVTNLRGMDLALWSGNGIPNVGDVADPTVVSGMPIEGMVHVSTLAFARTATAHGVPFRLRDYGNGVHTWRYWTRDLAQYLPGLMEVFAAPPAPPTSIAYSSIDRAYSQWGWAVHVERTEPYAMTGISNASRAGFVYAGGSGARVSTPAWFVPGRTYSVTVGATLKRAVANSAGRLTLTLSSCTTAVRFGA